MVKKGGLGKGLDALFADNSIENDNNVLNINIAEIVPNRHQPRKTFDEHSLVELSDSIKQYGILQPLLVKPIIDGGYQIIAGERRYRAAQMLGLTQIPVIVKQVDEKETMELALIENLQREDLSPIEEAEGYKQLIESYHLTQEEVANVVGKSRPLVTNSLRLLQLPRNVLELVGSGRISQGHARALLALSENKIESVAQRIIKDNLSVRDVEKLAKKKDMPKVKSANLKRNNYFDEIEISLRQELGRKIKVVGSGNKGTISIDFLNLEELRDIAVRLARNNDF